MKRIVLTQTLSQCKYDSLSNSSKQKLLQKHLQFCMCVALQMVQNSGYSESKPHSSSWSQMKWHSFQRKKVFCLPCTFDGKKSVLLILRTAYSRATAFACVYPSSLWKVFSLSFPERPAWQRRNEYLFDFHYETLNCPRHWALNVFFCRSLWSQKCLTHVSAG